MFDSWKVGRVATNLSHHCRNRLSSVSRKGGGCDIPRGEYAPFVPVVPLAVREVLLLYDGQSANTLLSYARR